MHQLSTCLQRITLESWTIKDCFRHELEMMQHLSSLQALELRGGNLSPSDSTLPMTTACCHDIARLTTLTKLAIDFRGKAEIQPELLGSLSQLRIVRLRGAMIDDFTIPGAWHCVQELNLNGNRLTRIPFGIARLTGLKRLYLQEQEADLQMYITRTTLNR
ncbi:hypothetical protein WJX73_006529 [Symbiochloris irregularis]|uniref:Uncharacterized protein n=1 Tax=Symbiochloris irregularis TaxID=706552 RepID=A0AAW1NH92_9CHLO